MNPTTAIHLDTRRIKSNETYPLKLRITYLRQRKYYRIGIDLSEEDWKRLNSPKPRGELKEIQLKTALLLEKADKVIKEIGEDFTFHKFEKEFFKRSKNTETLRTAYEDYISKLDKEGRVGTASSYQTALNSLSEFKSNLKFWDITPDFLYGYEKWMLKKGSSLTTVGVYLRTLRALINNAIEEGSLKREFYPFGKRRYQIPVGLSVKKALDMEEIGKIYNHPTIPGSPQEKAKDFWLFSYLANGMNIKDICCLKYKNIHGDKIVFNRKKTELTRRINPKPIIVILTEELRDIIKKYGNPEESPDNYIFPIFFQGITPKKERDLVQLFTKTTNKWIKRIAKEVGIAKNVTTYAARHSYCTILKNFGAPTEFIRDSVGHGSIDVTQNYFDKYPDDIKRKYAKTLLPFKHQAVLKKIAV